MAENNTTLNEDFAKLDEIIVKLNKSDISIEDAFKEYTQGMELLKACADKVDKVEKDVYALSENMKVTTFAGTEE